MKRYLLIAALVASFPTLAEASMLPKGSLLCGDKGEMDEAIRAIANSDAQWLKSLHSCIVTNQDVKIGLVEYAGHAAKVRFWLGKQSQIAYTLDKFIK